MHYFFVEPSQQDRSLPEHAARSEAPGPSRPPEVMQADSTGVYAPQGTIQEAENQLRLSYRAVENNPHFRVGGNTFLAYLDSQARSLGTVTKSDLEQWALTPSAKVPGKSKLPNARAFDGAKALCAMAAEAGLIDAQRASDIAACNRPKFDLESLRVVLQNPALTPKECNDQLHLNYQSTEKDPHRQTGARDFLAFLERKRSSLAEVLASDLEQWSLTTIPTGPDKDKLPSARAFEGAQAICALASEVGYLNAQKAKNLAECTRPRLDVNSLRMLLLDPTLTPKQRENQICLNYFSAEKNSHRQVGVNGMLAYLEKQAKSLAEVTKADLEKWALTPTLTRSGKSTLPTAQAFVGAKAFCALAAQVGHIDAQRAQDIAECPRPHYYLSSLLTMLQNPTLTPQERDHLIRLNYLSREPNSHRQAGANGILAYLESQAKSLAELHTSDLDQWALTPIPSGNLPNALAFQGAKALCALATETGLLDAQRAKEIALFPRPQFTVDALSTVLQNPALTNKERERYIHLTYQSAEKDSKRLSGASALLAYLAKQGSSLAQVSSSELEKWALTATTTGRGKGNLPNAQVFEGAKALCALAAQVGYIDVQSAKDISECSRPHYDVNSLFSVLQNPALSPKDREYQIHLNYQSWEKDSNKQAGASGFLAYLEKKGSSLAEVTRESLEDWTLTPLPSGRGQSNLPSSTAFEGAKALCALAAEVGHIDSQRAKELALSTREQLNVDSLCMLLQNPTLTPKQREYQILLHFQNASKNLNRQAGANGILGYLEKTGSSLAQVTTSDLEAWALTPRSTGKGEGNLPNSIAFEGAKALCALAAQVGYIDAQRAEAIATFSRPQFDIHSLHIVLQNPELTSKEREYHLYLYFQSAEKDFNRRAGAKELLAYLANRGKSIAEITISDLEQWALTPVASGKGHLPHPKTFQGAKAFCALAAQLGELDPQRAQEIAQCARPIIDVNSLRSFLQNPELTQKEREHHIRLHYQSAENDANRQAGANAIVAYLKKTGSSLAQVSAHDLEKWSLTPMTSGLGKGSLPRIRAFEGAKALCLLAAEVGHIDPQKTIDLLRCLRPQLGANSLRMELQNPALTPKEREHRICLHYQSGENDHFRLSGASGILGYLKGRGNSLVDVTASDLEQWALTSITTGSGKGKMPTAKAFSGAKALCALAAQVGHLDAQRAAAIAQSHYPKPRAQAASVVSDLHADKRPRIDTQGDEWYRRLAVSQPMFFDPDQEASSSQPRSSQSLI